MREVLDFDPATSGRRFRRRGNAQLSDAGRGARLRGWLDAGADHRARAVARAAGAAVMGGVAHHPSSTRCRGADHVAARSAPVGRGGNSGGPIEPRAAGSRGRARWRLAQFRGVWSGRVDVHQQLHRGVEPDEGGVVRRADRDVPRTFPGRRRSSDSAQAGSTPPPANLVRRQHSQGTGPRGAARRRVPRRRFVDDGQLRRGRHRRSATNSTASTRTRPVSPSANGST